jgi:hypothetical protein
MVLLVGDRSGRLGKREQMRILCITLDDETASRLGELMGNSNLGVNEQIQALIDLDYEEWKDQDVDQPRSARWIRFIQSEQN